MSNYSNYSWQLTNIKISNNNNMKKETKRRFQVVQKSLGPHARRNTIDTIDKNNTLAMKLYSIYN